MPPRAIEAWPTARCEQPFLGHLSSDCNTGIARNRVAEALGQAGINDIGITVSLRALPTETITL